jgi:hypothetical protein
VSYGYVGLPALNSPTPFVPGHPVQITGGSGAAPGMGWFCAMADVADAAIDDSSKTDFQNVRNEDSRMDWTRSPEAANRRRYSGAIRRAWP